MANRGWEDVVDLLGWLSLSLFLEVWFVVAHLGLSLLQFLFVCFEVLEDVLVYFPEN